MGERITVDLARGALADIREYASGRIIDDAVATLDAFIAQQVEPTESTSEADIAVDAIIELVECVRDEETLGVMNAARNSLALALTRLVQR